MVFREEFVTLEGKDGERKLAFTSWGDKGNDKVLFCVHGLSRNGRDFDFLANSLKDNYRVICIDVAGRGNSDRIKDKKLYNYDTYVKDVLYLLDKLDIKSVDWVGTSMGGIIGMIIAAKKTDLINKMILNDIGYHISGKALDRIFDYVGAKTEFNSYEEASRGLKARMMSFGVSEDEHWQHIFNHSIEEKNGVFVYRYDKDIVQKVPLSYRIIGNLKNPKRIGKCPDVDLSKFWNLVSCPVLLIAGEKSDILTEDVYNKMLSSGKEIDGVRIQEVGHAPMLMDEEQISLVKKWLL